MLTAVSTVIVQTQTRGATTTPDTTEQQHHRAASWEAHRQPPSSAAKQKEACPRFMGQPNRERCTRNKVSATSEPNKSIPNRPTERVPRQIEASYK